MCQDKVHVCSVSRKHLPIYVTKVGSNSKRRQLRFITQEEQERDRKRHTWTGAILGGSTTPLSSPCTMIKAPCETLSLLGQHCTFTIPACHTQNTLWNIVTESFPRQIASWLVPPTVWRWSCSPCIHLWHKFCSRVYTVSLWSKAFGQDWFYSIVLCSICCTILKLSKAWPSTLSLSIAYRLHRVHHVCHWHSIFKYTVPFHTAVPKYNKKGTRRYFALFEGRHQSFSKNLLKSFFSTPRANLRQTHPQ